MKNPRFIIHFFLLIVFTFTITSCQAPKEKEAGWSSVSGEVRPGPKTGKAVLALLSKARQASTSGQLATAESHLERALRIEPRNPTLWLYMAKLRLFGEKYTEAINLSKKALALSTGAPSEVNINELRSDCWRVIAHSYQKLGDIEQAKMAEEKASNSSY
jgi:tetratricopeptide (TPR) repeat protein